MPVTLDELRQSVNQRLVVYLYPNAEWVLQTWDTVEMAAAAAVKVSKEILADATVEITSKEKSNKDKTKKWTEACVVVTTSQGMLCFSLPVSFLPEVVSEDADDEEIEAIEAANKKQCKQILALLVGKIFLPKGKKTTSTTA